MPPIRSRMEAEDWLVRRLALEGPGLWTVREYREPGKKLAQDYRPMGPKWRVKEWIQRREGVPVYVVTGAVTSGFTEWTIATGPWRRPRP